MKSMHQVVITHTFPSRSFGRSSPLSLSVTMADVFLCRHAATQVSCTSSRVFQFTTPFIITIWHIISRFEHGTDAFIFINFCVITARRKIQVYLQGN